MTQADERVLFVTGRLAEPSLRRVLRDHRPPFECDIAVMKITVAALMTTDWIGRFLEVSPEISRVVIPGLCEGDTAPLTARFGIPVEKGPKDLRELPNEWSREGDPASYGAWNVEILAEINDAGRMAPDALVAQARYFRDSGADVIDIGCHPGVPFPHLKSLVGRLVSEGYRVSIDSFDPQDIRTAVEAGAEMVLSINGSNLDVIPDLATTGATVVVVPDFGGRLESLEPSINALETHGVRYVIDPILAPIGYGFMASLERYAEVRRRYPNAAMLMGVGNVTELTAADSTGINAVLMAACVELGIRHVLTTEVTPHARGAVRELDVARRLMHYAVTEQQIPKRIDDRLLTTKDASPLTFPDDELRRLQRTLTDPNFRIFADPDGITVLNNMLFIRGTNVRDVFEQLGVTDPSHAFYLGTELARAQLAMQLGKTYRQDSPLSWGYLTPPDEPTRQVRLSREPRRQDDE